MNLFVEYCRLSTTMTFLSPEPQVRSSVRGLGPIRDTRSENLAGMHAIGGGGRSKQSWHGCREVRVVDSFGFQGGIGPWL
jgi:hypothetical protein